MAKIPIHHILGKLGLGDIVIDNPKDLEKFKKHLDELIKIEQKKEKLQEKK